MNATCKLHGSNLRPNLCSDCARVAPKTIARLKVGEPVAFEIVHTVDVHQREVVRLALR